ncbi:MAG: phage holin family protein [Sneathiella sp.]|uniref:phage holin family protein n=1 Tax=Sneathiella sp. TaxID=1964365 RepID=UPI0030018C89
MIEKLLSLLPGELLQSAISFCTTLIASVFGRLLYHVQLSQKGLRRFFSWHLFFELATAISIAFAAEGIAAYFGLEGKPAFAAIVAISYIGPRGIEVAFQRFVKSK